MDKKKSVFRQESLDRVESPEQLDRYIQVSKPSAWILAAALLILAVSVLVWSFTGSLPQTVMAKGVVRDDGSVFCYLDPSQIQGKLDGCKVLLTMPDNSTTAGVISETGSVPYSSKEVAEILKKDWIIQQVIASSYVYQLKVTPDKELQSDVIVNAAITVKEVKPIEYIMN